MGRAYFYRVVLITCCWFNCLSADVLLVGIAGGSGSGKTTLAQHLNAALGDRVTVISQDNYYRHNPHLSLEERERINYDHPDSLEFSLLAQHLTLLKQGKTVQLPTYDFSTHLRTSKTESVTPTSIIVVEGILVLAVQELVEQFDLKIFVDTDDDTRLLRRIERDTNERGRSFSQIRDQYLRTVKPMYEQFVAPCRKTADVIVPQGGFNDTAVAVISQYLQANVNPS